MTGDSRQRCRWCARCRRSSSQSCASGCRPSRPRCSRADHAACRHRDVRRHRGDRCGARRAGSDQAAGPHGLARCAAKNSTVFNGRGGKADRFRPRSRTARPRTGANSTKVIAGRPAMPGLYVIPALIAEGEATGASTEDTLRALVLGYEVVARFARAFPPKAPVLHPHASLAAIGAAAGIGALRRFDARALNSALTSASTMVAPGPYRHAVEGALVRNVWPAAGAWCGLQAVEWAECGIGGTPQSPYDVFVMVFDAGLVADQFSVGLGDEWAIADGYHKVHACCQYSHSTVEAIIDLHGRLGDRMQRVQQHRGRDASARHDVGQPRTRNQPCGEVLHSRTSRPLPVFRARRRGRVHGRAPRTMHRLRCCGRKWSSCRFENVPAWPNDRPARVTVTLDDGSTHTSNASARAAGLTSRLVPK